MHTNGLNDIKMEITNNNNSVDKLNFDNNQLIEWTREKTLKLLKEYKSRRVLWDWNNRGYRDRVKRKSAIQELANLFNCNTLEIEKKITNLKCQYSREVHKIQKSQERSPNNIYESKWFAYESMLFLQFGTRRYSSRRKKIKKVKQEEKEEYIVSDIDPESIQYDEDDENESGAESQKLLINEDVDDETTNSSFNLRASQLYNVSMSNDSSNTLSQNNFENIVNNDNNKLTDGRHVGEDIVKFGESIACQLSQIPDSYSRSVAKLKINQILFEAEIGVYAQERR